MAYEMLPNQTVIPNPVKSKAIRKEWKQAANRASERPDLIARRLNLSKATEDIVKKIVEPLSAPSEYKNSIARALFDYIVSNNRDPRSISLLLKKDGAVHQIVNLDLIDLAVSLAPEPKSQFREQISKQVQVLARSWNLLRAGVTKEGYDQVAPMIEPLNEKERERLRRIFGKAQTLIIDQILSGRKETELNSHEKNILTRIRTTKIFDSSEIAFGALLDSGCLEDIGQNARYIHNLHAVNACPGVGRLPENALIQVLAHELTHSIAPCASQFPIFQVEKEKILAIRAESKSLPPYGDPKDFDKKDFFESIAYTNPPDHLILGSFLMNTPKALVDEFMKLGVLKVHTAGIEAMNYPLNKLASCLSDKSGINRPKPEEIDSLVEKFIENRKKMLGDKYDGMDDKLKILATLKQYPGCFSLGNSDQLEEAIPNWMGVSVVGEVMKPKEKFSPLEVREAFGWTYGLACSESDVSPSDGLTLKKTKEMVTKAIARDEDPHPYARIHFENFILENPDISKVLGCATTKKEEACGLGLGSNTKKLEGQAK